MLRGKKLVIDCQADGIPVPIHQWKRSRTISEPRSNLELSSGTSSKHEVKELSNSREFSGIVSGPHVHVLENGSLAILDSSKSDEGEYLCEVSNGIGSVLSSSTAVRVRSGPSFGKNFEVLKSIQGGKAVLTCDVFGDDPIKVVWSKERQVLSSSYHGLSKHIIEESSTSSTSDGITRSVKLFVDNVQVSDSSIYICSATNPFGSDSKNFQLVVQGPPLAPSNVAVTNVGSRTITLEWIQKPGTESNSPITNFVIQSIPNNGTF